MARSAIIGNLHRFFLLYCMYSCALEIGMSKVATKTELLAEIKIQRQRLEKNLAGLSVEELRRPGVCGDWSIKDILAHLAAWEQMFMGWYAVGLRGETPDLPWPGKLHQTNQEIYERYRAASLESVQALFAESYCQMLAWVESLPDEELFTPGKYAWLNGARLADWTASNTFNHYVWAKNLVRKSKTMP